MYTYLWNEVLPQHTELQIIIVSAHLPTNYRVVLQIAELYRHRVDTQSPNTIYIHLNILFFRMISIYTFFKFQVAMTLVSIPLMDRTGRRTLHLYGLGGMFIFSIFITISFLIKASIEILKIIRSNSKCSQIIQWNG